MPAFVASLIAAALLCLVLPWLPRRPTATHDQSGRLTEAQRNQFVAVGAGLLIGLGVWAVFGAWVIALVFSLIGVVVPGWLDHMRRQRRNDRMVEQLETTVRRMASAMSGSGMTAENAWIEAAAEVTDEPLGPVLVQIKGRLFLGGALAEILRERGHYLGVPEFGLIAMATGVMGSMGGNLAERYRSASEMLAQRRADRATMVSMTTEARMSVYIVGAIPFLVFALFRYLTPELMAPLLGTAAGQVVIFVALGIILAGIAWALRIAQTE